MTIGDLTPDDEAAEPEWARRKRLAAVFGDVFPEQTSDDRPAPSAESADLAGKGDEWYHEQVPPHHG